MLIPSVDVDDLSEGAIVSEPELEYDENASVEESDLSGSEFEASDNEPQVDEDFEEEFPVKTRKSPRKSRTILDADFEDDSEGEEIMMDAAIQESLHSARMGQISSNGAGPSSSRPKASSKSAAALRAAAAEKRLAHSKGEDVDSDEFQIALETEEEAQSSSEEEAFTKTKGKGKGKKAPKKTVIVRDTSSTKFMSLSERRALNREKRKLAKSANSANRKEELAMIKQFGRKLTYVRNANVFSGDSVSHGLYVGGEEFYRSQEAPRGTERCLGRPRKKYRNCGPSEG